MTESGNSAGKKNCTNILKVKFFPVVKLASHH